MRVSRTGRRGLLALVVLGAVLWSGQAWAGEVERWSRAIESGLGMIPDPFTSSRHAASAYTAVSDALNAIERRYEPYAYDGRTSGASQTAAIAAAAHTVLTASLREYAAFGPLVPSATIQAGYDSTYAAALATVPDGPAEDAGVALGRAAANAILARRASDRVLDAFFAPYLPGTAPGDYQPLELPGIPFRVLLPGYATSIAPYVIERADQFRPPPPRRLDSWGYLIDFYEVRFLGAEDSLVRTDEQRQIALFWYENSVTGWSRIARELAVARGLDEWDQARLLALLTLSIADGTLAQFDGKYTYNRWRPVTAIRAADTGNPRAASDPTWTPLCPTPPTPEYPSGHSINGSAAAVILGEVFGHHVAFSATSATLPGVARTFRSFAQAAAENADSRVYCGIHFRSSTVAGLEMGQQIARYVLDHALRPTACH
jgi:membrane-associated phospholipid phosphatase